MPILRINGNFLNMILFIVFLLCIEMREKICECYFRHAHLLNNGQSLVHGKESYR